MQKPLEIIVKVEEAEVLSKITCDESLSILNSRMKEHQDHKTAPPKLPLLVCVISLAPTLRDNPDARTTLAACSCCVPHAVDFLSVFREKCGRDAVMKPV